jgi:hypothetical protein
MAMNTSAVMSTPITVSINRIQIPKPTVIPWAKVPELLAKLTLQNGQA